jgi:hypothetical protein
MADEKTHDEKTQDYEEPSLTDLEDVSGGGENVCSTGIVVEGPVDGN